MAMERGGKVHSCPGKGAGVGAASGLGAWLTFKAISRCFRNVSSREMSPGTARGTNATHCSSLPVYGER